MASGQDVQDALTKDKKSRTQKEQNHVDESHAQRNKITIDSETIGEAAMKRMYPDFKLEYSKKSSGKFDQIYVKQGPPKEFIIVEAKGGKGKIGSAEIGSAEESLRVEQGTIEYRELILNKMKGTDPKLNS